MQGIGKLRELGRVYESERTIERRNVPSSDSDERVWRRVKVGFGERDEADELAGREWLHELPNGNVVGLGLGVVLGMVHDRLDADELAALALKLLFVNGFYCTGTRRNLTLDPARAWNSSGVFVSGSKQWAAVMMVCASSKPPPQRPGP
jgi:hypothetical protein